MMAHVTVVTRRAGRRISDARGARYNLCGAEPTDRDIPVRDAKRAIEADVVKFHICRVCLARAK